jgi:ABC-type iron transport system FetAB ATPase subunit
VRFDGRDIRSFDPRELRRRVALVMQTAVMFEGTVPTISASARLVYQVISRRIDWQRHSMKSGSIRNFSTARLRRSQGARNNA